MNELHKDFISKLNRLGKEKKAFFFLMDFELKKPFVCEISELSKEDILIKTPFFQNYKNRNEVLDEDFNISPVAFSTYKKAIEGVIKEIKYGNSYLTNLTFPSQVITKNTLDSIFYAAHSLYKLKFKEEFVSFSPETFISIKENEIFSYPMKGTIDASIPNAKQLLLNNEKEKNEHYTIVDLIRNDLSMIAEKVEVTKFRYLQKIKTNRKTLFQVSSEIKGTLPADWQEKIGDLLFKILPAGSISGAPKKKTLEIIQKYEQDERGYYTGIFGLFDGEKLDSAVNIRYLEKQENQFIYRSGGGITALSNPKEEYHELIDKIYIPII